MIYIYTYILFYGKKNLLNNTYQFKSHIIFIHFLDFTCLIVFTYFAFGLKSHVLFRNIWSKVWNDIVLY